MGYESMSLEELWEALDEVNKDLSQRGLPNCDRNFLLHCQGDLHELIWEKEQEEE